MDNINLENLKGAFHGFVSSVTQTGTNVSTNLGSSFANLGDTISNKLPTQLTSVLGVRPLPPPPPPKLGVVDHLNDWCQEHPKLAAVSLLGGISAVFCALYLSQPKPAGCSSRNVPSRGRQTGSGWSLASLFGKSSHSPPRLAHRALSGGRKDVVLLVGSPNEPLVRLIAQDLNIRGFIVYITATPSEEAALAREVSDGDEIYALKLDSYFDATSVQGAIAQLQQVLDTKTRTFAGAEPHSLVLSSILIIPDLFYHAGPIELTSASQWAQTVQSKIQMPLNFLSLGAVELARRQRSRFVIVTPAIIGSLSPAFHSSESIVYGALSALALSLTRELEPQGIPVTHLKLGSFDTRAVKMRSPSPRNKFTTPSEGRQGTPHQGFSAVRNPSTAGAQADILSWPENMRRLYGSRYTASASTSIDCTQGSSLRELFHSIYDTIYAPSPSRVVRAGKGSRIYEWVMFLMPEWMLTRFLAAHKYL